MKNKYSFLGNLRYIFKVIKELDKETYRCMFLNIPIDFILIVIELFIPTIIVAILETKKGYMELIGVIVVCFAIRLIFKVVQNKINAKKYVLEHRIILYFMTKINSKLMDIDYYYLENPDTKIKMEKANQASLNNHTEAVQMGNNFFECLKMFLNLLLYISLLALLNPFIIVVLFVSAVVEYIIIVMYDTYQYRTREERMEVNRKLYYFSEVSDDYSKGKDIRLFNMRLWIEKMNNQFLKNQFILYKKLAIKKNWMSFFEFIIVLLRNGICMLYLIKMIFENSISLAEFLLFYSIINQFVDVLGEFVDRCEVLVRGKYQVCDIRDFLEFEDFEERGNSKIEKGDIVDIKLENINYAYPNSEKNILNNINLHIHKNEKIAIVGPNGAGKTTLVKILTGMYRPINGSIYINNENIYIYDKQSINNIYSAVFQKFRLLPLSIAENICFKDYDEEKLWNCIKMSTLDNKVNTLEKKENTKLIKEINPEGINLSGGEEQKMMISRAIYKSGYVYILDEPTAALDPIAEDKLYMKYLELSQYNTSIFITHRYAFTRFCDRIVYLENGEIIEEGTHDELIQLRGKYWKSFMLQCQYYNELDDGDIYNEIFN